MGKNSPRVTLTVLDTSELEVYAVRMAEDRKRALWAASFLKSHAISATMACFAALPWATWLDL